MTPNSCEPSVMSSISRDESCDIAKHARRCVWRGWNSQSRLHQDALISAKYIDDDVVRDGGKKFEKSYDINKRRGRSVNGWVEWKDECAEGSRKSNNFFYDPIKHIVLSRLVEEGESRRGKTKNNFWHAMPFTYANEIDVKKFSYFSAATGREGEKSARGPKRWNVEQINHPFSV